MLNSKTAALIAAISLFTAGCSNTDSSSSAADVSSENENPTSVTTTTAATSDAKPQESQPALTTTDSSEAVTVTESTSATTRKVTPLKASEYCSYEGNTFKSEYFKCMLAYPDDWLVAESDTTSGDTSMFCLLGTANSSDNSIMSKLEACSYSDETEIDKLVESFRQTYEDIAEAGGEDPLAIKDLQFSQPQELTLGALSGQSFVISYTQRSVDYYVYTAVYRLESSEKDFLIATFNYNDADKQTEVEQIINSMQILDLTP